ncbi:MULTISPECIES: ABC transporter substrate-binding protein [unclassified Streptomyces]|uniref:ABC transporter substrate-binding protein n=1 Tax=unclassified Streptomyces TaxID=2593676 RepID=UPI002255F353|nr:MULTISPECIES: ABC transporter substrate-binding protein [unclassified Streptomyces]MCX4406014.1 ABC transporter substrate-binding protein [Streptomyces sp. NBC_01764]MCX5189462.1 ABC transporter substrate-binding protein [Streptomyces sp. NBC_00268]
MLNRIRRLSRTAAALAVSLAAGCGVPLSGSTPIVVGTTSSPTTLDPAASWDGSWELFRNVYQTLLSYHDGAGDPVPDAAKSCGFTDTSDLTYRCTLRTGLTFSNGDELDAQAVKYSIDRIRRINVSSGPAGLLANLGRVATTGDREVVFHLKSPDATFPFVLTTPAMSIVDPADYPATAIREDGHITGSGPYTLRSYEAGEQAVLVGNEDYQGAAERKNDAVTIRYFHSSADLADALQSRKIDVTYMGLAASDVIALQRGRFGDDVSVTESAGVDISYLVFNPSDRWSGQLAVRKAVAQVVDRAAIAHNVYADTVEPLYSMVPAGLTGHAPSYFDEFGDPSTAEARKILSDAGISERVPLTLWYTTDRYGSETALEFRELKRQLEASGLFTVTLKGRPWTAFVDGYEKGEYPVFGRGWFPDFPDADNYISPFVGVENALGTPYKSPRITGKLLPESRRESDRTYAVPQFREAQQIFAGDARLIPLWQGKQHLAAHKDIIGVQRALDPSSIMMMWELAHGG